MNLPNKLSVIRLLLIPIIMTTFYVEFPYHYIVSCALFGIAAFTDFLDGYIARKYNLITDLGKFLDSSADKVLVLTILILLLDAGLLTGGVFPSFIGGLCVSVILAREILISCLRMVTAAKGVVMAADKLGKVKTTLQDVSIIFFLLAGELCENGTIYKVCEKVQTVEIVHKVILFAGLILFGLAIIMTVVSAVHYVYVYGRKLEDNAQ